LVVVAAFVAQRTILSGLHVHRAQPDLMVLIVVLAGLIGGAERGAIVGFLTGLFVDLFLQTPFGLSALAFTLVGWMMGKLRSAIVDAAPWLVPVGAAAGSAVYVVLYAVLEALVGHPDVLRHGLVAAVVLVAAVNGILAVPVAWVMRWAMVTSPSRPSSPATGPGGSGSRWGAGVSR
ncbi:MAG: rod shape-determining protein MreD, partial [Acidimicrobiales bacterium]